MTEQYGIFFYIIIWPAVSYRNNRHLNIFTKDIFFSFFFLFFYFVYLFVVVFVLFFNLKYFTGQNLKKKKKNLEIQQANDEILENPINI